MDSVKEFGIGMIPVVGAGYDIYQAIQDPSLANIIIAGTSTGLDTVNLLSGGTASIGVAALKGVIKGGVKKAIKDQVVRTATKEIEKRIAREAGTRVTHSIHRRAAREASNRAKNILIQDVKKDMLQQFMFNNAQLALQTKDGKFIWQR